MASQLGKLDLSNAEESETWLMAFSALARTKDWKDDNNRYNITDNFMAQCGLAALQKIQFMIAPKVLSDTKFNDIKTVLHAYLQPKNKIIIVERTEFYQMKQNENESAADYIIRLKKKLNPVNSNLLNKQTTRQKK